MIVNMGLYFFNKLTLCIYTFIPIFFKEPTIQHIPYRPKGQIKTPCLFIQTQKHSDKRTRGYSRGTTFFSVSKNARKGANLIPLIDSSDRRHRLSHDYGGNRASTHAEAAFLDVKSNPDPILAKSPGSEHRLYNFKTINRLYYS